MVRSPALLASLTALIALSLCYPVSCGVVARALVPTFTHVGKTADQHSHLAGTFHNLFHLLIGKWSLFFLRIEERPQVRNSKTRGATSYAIVPVYDESLCLGTRSQL